MLMLKLLECQGEALIKSFLSSLQMTKSSIRLGCQAELVEADVLIQTRLRQAQADSF
jgi:hypothetical protein